MQNTAIVGEVVPGSAVLRGERGPGALACGLGTASVTRGLPAGHGAAGTAHALLQGLPTRMSEVGAGVERRLPRHLLL